MWGDIQHFTGVKRLVVVGLVIAGIGVAGWLVWRAAHPDDAKTADTVAVPTPGAQGGRWIAIGGGSTPEMNQVSIEQDMALAANVLGEGGRLLFGGGPGTNGVQVLDAEPRGDPLIAQLAQLFAPRQGRDAHYRRTTLSVDEPASVEAATQTIRAELAGDSRDPLLLYFAGHGEQGEQPRDNLMRLWGRQVLTVADLANLLDAAPAERRIRIVATTCFSGGFGELVFQGADSANGPTPNDRCGLFASTWDLEATGCDPDPNRRAQQGYGIHFFNALRGRDRDGKRLQPGQADFDGDGRISLLEAHTRVRVASQSSDVPTTTSERWLRQVAPSSGPSAPIALPEEDAVIEAMLARPDMRGNESRAADLLVAAQAAFALADADLQDATELEDQAFSKIAAALLARWPVLDDPWHPDFQSTITSHGPEIAAFLKTSTEYKAFLGVSATVGRLDEFVGKIRTQSAPLERLVRAMDNKQLAARLKAKGGPDWDHYAKLLACERSGPTGTVDK